MEKIKQTVEIDRYELKTYNDAEYGFINLLDYFENLTVIFNKNNTGGYNFLNAEEYTFESAEEIENYTKELDKKHYTVISLYQENGYVGVYNRTGDDCLKVKCNNWVDSGRNGFIYVVFADSEEEIDEFVNELQKYINFGIEVWEVYDNLEDEFVYSFSNIRVTQREIDEFEEFIKKEYDLDLW